MIPAAQDLPTWLFPLCPAPPDWSLDWQGLQARFGWLEQLRGCAQDPLYHAEGDVLTHTGMVCEALVHLPAWQQLPATTRSILFAAALLHDVGKPTCTAAEPDGRISSRGHARVGAKLARRVLWRADPFDTASVPLVCRELVVALVRHHGLPIYLLEREDPQRAVIAASQVVDCRWLALLAEADALGRVCLDGQELLDRIDLFRQCCHENGCLGGTRQFASDHSRFVYFRKRHADPDYAAYDDTRCEVVLMSGLPAAGKDRWIADHRANWPMVSLDALRTELGIPPHDSQGAVIDEARRRAREHLRAERSFVWNATNITRVMRERLIDLFAGYRARISVVYLEAPYRELVRRNDARAAPVPQPVLERLADMLEVPNLTEAHQVQWVVR